MISSLSEQLAMGKTDVFLCISFVFGVEWGRGLVLFFFFKCRWEMCASLPQIEEEETVA